MDCFLFDSDLHHERVKKKSLLNKGIVEQKILLKKKPVEVKTKWKKNIYLEYSKLDQWYKIAVYYQLSVTKSL